MTIEEFKNDMIESIEKRIASGVVLMSKKSYAEWTCAECAVTMLFRDRFNSNKSYINFEHMCNEVTARYGVPLAAFIGAFDDEHPVEGWGPGSHVKMYNLGKELRAKYNPVTYDDLIGKFLVDSK